MKKHPIIFLIIGIIILIVPTSIYLGFLVPEMSEEYNILMASGGIIGGVGFYGANSIPEKISNSKLYKISANSFTVLTIITLINQFIMEVIGLVAVFIVSFIIFIIFKGLWKNGKRRKENTELATEITRSVVETIK